MKYVRYRYRGRDSYGILDGETVKEIGSLFGKREETGREFSVTAVRLLWPCEPSKVLAIAWNYQSHLADRPVPRNPEIFFVPPSALLEPAGVILIPPDARTVHYEGELVAVIGKETCNVTPAEAGGCILGFTCGNDVSEREWQKTDRQWWRAKGSDTFAPLGPAIVTDFDWRRGRIETRVNGSVVQSGNFAELLFDPLEIISFASRYATLLPGDVIYTGTPGDTGDLRPGDLVEVEIPGIGILRNMVAMRS